jgi:hypothetical protein
MLLVLAGNQSMPQTDTQMLAVSVNNLDKIHKTKGVSTL